MSGGRIVTVWSASILASEALARSPAWRSAGQFGRKISGVSIARNQILSRRSKPRQILAVTTRRANYPDISQLVCLLVSRDERAELRMRTKGKSLHAA